MGNGPNIMWLRHDAVREECVKNESEVERLTMDFEARAVHSCYIERRRDYRHSESNQGKRDCNTKTQAIGHRGYSTVTLSANAMTKLQTALTMFNERGIDVPSASFVLGYPDRLWFSSSLRSRECASSSAVRADMSFRQFDVGQFARLV